MCVRGEIATGRQEPTQSRWLSKSNLWVLLKEIKNPGLAGLLPTKGLSLLPDSLLTEWVASV
jgi:hypothetical protein